MSNSSGIQGGDVFDLLLVVDATGSSHPFHDALRSSLPEIIRFSTVAGAFSRIGVLAYRDYTEQDLLEWSGWCDLTVVPRNNEHWTEKYAGHPRDKRVSHNDLVKFSRFLWNRGGKDHAEAVKTALAMAHSVMREEATTVTFLYADAPPHLARFPTMNQKAETAALTAGSYGGFGGQFAEWTSACRMLAGEAGKKAVVHCIVPDEPKMVVQTLGFLSAVTGGVFLEVPGRSEDAVSRATIGVLLAWMGVGEGGGRPYVRRRYYANLECLEAINSEGQLLGSNKDRISEKPEWRMLGQHVTTADLYHIVAPRATPIPDFASRYTVNETYRTLVTDQLRAIIEIDPATVTLNPVFTTLFRVLCRDLSNPARDEIVELFSQTAAQVRFGERRRLKEWLAESYDFSGEVEARIGNVHEKDLFPCVYFDETQHSTPEEETQPVHGPSLLLDEDQRIFDMLVEYKMVEKNMRTPLTARVGWTPKTARMSAGPMVTCRRCNHSRSITMMAEDNVCGTCSSEKPLGPSTKDAGELETLNRCNIWGRDGGETIGTWVECRVAACRAQYVTYTAVLRGPPKCFYCRSSRQAPTVQCTKCLNRVIYPEEYRPAKTDFSTWKCVACESGLETIVEVKTAAKQLVEDNGRDWLLRIEENALNRSWSGRPLHHIARFTPSQSFIASKVSILPESNAVLTLSGKTVHNTESLKDTLRAIVHRRAFASMRASDHPEALR